MNRIKYLCLSVSLCLAAAAAAWGQTPNAKVVYVATGQSQVYAVPTDGSGSFMPLISTSSQNYSTGAAYTSLAVGPDNSTDNASGTGNGNGDWFFLYACDQTNNTIVRLQLSVSNPGSQAKYTDLVTNAVPAPVCGRVDANGDLYVSSATSGQGVWVIPGVSATTGGSAYAGTANKVSFTFPAGTSFTGGGITQKNVGDMLLVDSNDGQILKAAYSGGSSPSTSLTQYVTGLSSPIGIARAEVPEPAKNPTTTIGDFFVLNQTRQGYALLKFDPSTLPKSSVCLSSPNGNASLTSVAASEDNFLYVGVGGNSKNTWAVDILSAASCQSVGVGTISLSTLASPTGVAVPPVSAQPVLTTYPTDPSSGVTVNSYNFGSSLLNVAPGTCSLTNVTQTPMSSSFLNSLAVSGTSLSYGGWLGGAVVTSNGEGGFVTVYHVTGSPSGCIPADIQTNMLIDAFYDTNPTDTTAVLNPRVIHCKDGFPSSPSCDVIDATGNWPQGGYLPGDQTSGTKIKGFGSLYFLANGTLASGTDLGTFCGFQSPLVDGATQGAAPAFNSGQGLSVKFKLGEANYGGCTGGNYVTDAIALLSVSQIADGQGNPTFAPMTLTTQGSSTDNPPIFKYNPNSQNYQFSLSLKGYAKGIYALTITFLSNNAPSATTYFIVQ